MIIYVAYRDIYIANGYERTVIGLKKNQNNGKNVNTKQEKRCKLRFFLARVAIHNEQQAFILHARVCV